MLNIMLIHTHSCLITSSIYLFTHVLNLMYEWYIHLKYHVRKRKHLWFISKVSYSWVNGDLLFYIMMLVILDVDKINSDTADRLAK